MREEKRRQWRARGYSEKMITDALRYADNWCEGMAKQLIGNSELRKQAEDHLFPEALKHSDNFIEAMVK